MGSGSTRHPGEAIPRNSENSSFVSKPWKHESRSQAPLNLLGGYQWPNPIQIKPELQRRVIHTEIGVAGSTLPKLRLSESA